MRPAESAGGWQICRVCVSQESLERIILTQSHHCTIATMHGLIQQSASIHAFHHSAVVWLHVISSAFDPHLPQICTPQIQAPDGSAIAGHSMVPFFGIQGLASFVDPKNSLNEMRLMIATDIQTFPNQVCGSTRNPFSTLIVK